MQYPAAADDCVRRRVPPLWPLLISGEPHTPHMSRHTCHACMHTRRCTLMKIHTFTKNIYESCTMHLDTNTYVDEWNSTHASYATHMHTRICTLTKIHIFANTYIHDAFRHCIIRSWVVLLTISGAPHVLHM